MEEYFLLAKAVIGGVLEFSKFLVNKYSIFRISLSETNSMVLCLFVFSFIKQTHGFSDIFYVKVNDSGEEGKCYVLNSSELENTNNVITGFCYRYFSKLVNFVSNEKVFP